MLSLSASDNAELFWACRGGGGGNFGINTSFTLRTFTVAPVCVFAIKWSGESGQSEKVFPVLMQALDAAPNTLGSRVSLAAVTKAQFDRGEDVPIDLLGQFKGQARDLMEILAPAYRIAPASSHAIHEMSYWDGQEFLKEASGGSYYHERSAFLNEGVLEDRALAVAFEWLRQWPGTRAGADLRFFQTGGQVNALPPNATAFVHRSSRWIMDIGLDWTALDPPEVVRRSREWQDGFYQAMRTFTNGHAYQNFSDPALTDWQHAYHGDNFARLTQVKRAVDPTSVFRFDQAIPPG